MSRSCQGFSLAELLVALLIFGVVGMAAVSICGSALRDLGTESRMTMKSLQLNQALGLLSNELRMSSNLSPYLPGNNASLSNCAASVAVTATTMKFFVVEDDSTATTTSGIKPYYVGYKYDASAKQLLRGEIPVDSLISCVVPGDPTSATYAKPLANHVVAIDSDDNGTVDPAFAKSGAMFTVSLGVSASVANQGTKQQKLPTKVFERIS